MQTTTNKTEGRQKIKGDSKQKAEIGAKYSKTKG